MPTINSSPNSTLPSFADPNSGRIVVLADDLTGACDAASAFLRTGRSVRVWFGSIVEFSAPETVQAFNTNSRSLPPPRAARAVAEAVSNVGSGRNSLFFKKVDSAARGPFAAEILAAHRALSTRAVLIAPAFPSAGRTVRNGILHIHDAAGQSTEVPLANLFSDVERERVAEISGASEIAPAFTSGKSIFLCNTESQADLEALARATHNLPGLLLAGSAGFAQALASLSQLKLPPLLVPPASQTLLIAGSSHPVTVLQLENLDRQRFPGVEILQIESSFRSAARVSSAFRDSSPRALILTGGETALLAARALEAHSFILQGELASGIPWGLVQGGVAHGCVVVTKSGGFGGPGAFNEILAALRGPQ